jgi:hypothetical protein
MFFTHSLSSPSLSAPYYPGGVAFQRNAPPPTEILHPDHGLPEFEEKRKEIMEILNSYKHQGEHEHHH